jgi:Protein of unknown function (DUF4087)
MAGRHNEARAVGTARLLSARRVSVGSVGGTSLVRLGLEHRLTKTPHLFAAGAALLMVCACSPEANAPATQESDIAANRVGPQPQPAVRKETAELNRAEAAPKAIAASGRRCGWLYNPTPANWWLVDGDGQWVLGSQGSEPVAGMEDMPDMSAVEWVETNGHYGYGCACMDMEVDPASGDVLRVSKATPKPLAQCRADPKLPKPDAG